VNVRFDLATEKVIVKGLETMDIDIQATHIFQQVEETDRPSKGQAKILLEQEANQDIIQRTWWPSGPTSVVLLVEDGQYSGRCTKDKKRNFVFLKLVIEGFIPGRAPPLFLGFHLDKYMDERVIKYYGHYVAVWRANLAV
jgi:hypothetical protein